MTSDPGDLPHPTLHEKSYSWLPILEGLTEKADWDRDLIEHSHDLLCIHDLEGKLLSVNPRPAQLLGYTVEELLRIPMRNLIAPRFQSEFDEYLRAIVRDGEASGLLAVQTRTGEKRIWEYHNSLRTEGVPKPLVRAVAHDVTDRIRIEKELREGVRKLSKLACEQEETLRSLKLFRTLLDNSNDAIEVVDPLTMCLLDVNETACHDLGYSRDELLSMTVFDIDPRVTQERAAQVREHLRKVGFLILETEHRRKNGTTFPVEVNLQRVELDKQYVVAVSRDMTDRKLRDDRLQEYERLLEGLAEIVSVVDRDHRYVIANHAFLTRRQLTREQVIGRHVRDVLGADAYETIKPRLDEAFQDKEVTYPLRLSYPGIGERDLMVTYLPVKGPSGIERVAAVIRDVTERERAEEALRESEERFRSLYENSTIGLYRTTPDGRILLANPSLVKMLGFSSFSELSKRNLDQEGFEPGYDRTKFRRQLEDDGEIRGLESSWTRRDGTAILVRESAKAIRNAEGEILYYEGTVEDLTERESAQQALRESEERMRLAQQAAGIGVFERNMQAGGSVWSPEMEAIFGLPAGMAPKTVEALMQLVHPEDREPLQRSIDQSIETRTGTAEWRVIWPDRSLHWISGRWRVFYDKEGRPLRALGVDLDITERKRAEEALRESEERMRLAQEVAQIGTFDRDLATGKTRWTTQLETMYGLPPGGAPRTIAQFLDLIHPSDRKRMSELVDRSIQTGEGHGEWRVVWPDGTVHWILGRWRVFHDANGRPVRLIGADYDITHRKRVEHELRLAKERLTEEKLYLEHVIDTEFGFEDIIGRSLALKAVMESASRVASSGATVLLLGETGTGKELVARAIHRLSPRAGNPFIKMNCAAIPSGLLESELFGAEKGAFTGSTSRKIGRLELADKGTLFLDEIGEMPLALQPKLLRVLQDLEFERLGGTKTLKVDFRLIAATNRDLAEQVQDNQFRRDLYYRLNVFPIHLPPLRERRDDIPLLVEHFVRKIAQRMGKPIMSIPKKTMDALVNWRWPGNVRELENFIERSVILTHGTVLAAPLSELEAPIATGDRNNETLEAAERRYILEALRQSNGRISGENGAAARLGLKRTTLQSKLKQMGINPRTPPAN